MPAGRYAVVRYVPDPARDEPLNIGLIAAGPAGACYATDNAALERLRIADPMIDPQTIPHVQQYVERLVSAPLVRVTAAGIDTIQPHDADFLDGLRERLPERFTLGNALFIEYADENRVAMEDAAADLVLRLVKPVTRKPVFPRDPGAPFERLKKLLRDPIKSGQVRVRPAIQGSLTHRVRRPDFYYKDRAGSPVVIAMVKMTQRQWHALSQTADAKAFELYDLKAKPGLHTVAVVDQPEPVTPEYNEAVQSIHAVSDEVMTEPGDIEALASRVQRDLALV